MSRDLELNRLEFLILDTLYESGCKDHFHSMTITELLESNENALGARMTVYKKMKKLLKAGYIKNGVLDNHADTFYIVEKGIELVEGGKEK